MNSERRRLIITATISFACSVVAGVTALVVSLQSNAESDRKWCSVIGTLDEGYNAPVRAGQPTLSERGQRLATNIHDLHGELGCPPDPK